MCMSDNSCAEDETRHLPLDTSALEEVLLDHARQSGCRSHLLDMLDRLDDVEDKAQGCRQQELNVLLLYSSFLGRGELLPVLHKSGANLNHSEPELGMNAMDLCAYSNCLEGLRYLLRQGATVARKAYTPFHLAVFGNALDVARFFLEQSWSQESPLVEESVLHVASRCGSVEVLRLLLSKPVFLDRLDGKGFAPVHYAADRAEHQVLELLVAAGCDVDLATSRGDTALHIAASASCAENLAVLLARKSATLLAARNRRGQSALHMAARAQSLECVELLLQAGCEPDLQDSDGRAALHLALGKSLLAHDVASVLVAWKARVDVVDKYGYAPLHVAALNELSQCVDLLIVNGADLGARTRGGTSALSVILRKTPSSLDAFERILDASVTLDKHGSAAGEAELRIDFRPLLQNREYGEIGYLGTFVKEGYKEILEHPLCQAFLYLKWQKIRKYYVGRLLFYLFYVLVLTAWVITALAHNCYNESHGQVESHAKRLCANNSGINGYVYMHPVVLEMEWYALVFLTALETIRKMAGILTYTSARQFFTQAENIVEWCVVVSVFATSFVYTGRTYAWQSHVGAFAVLCGWSNLMLMIGQLPMFGAYVAMFTSVQAQVFKLLLAYACLLVGFTASFCVIFPESKSFSSPHTGLIKVLVMMTGELDFEELFFPVDEDVAKSTGTSWILLQVSAQLSFVLFLLFVTIVLMNLLVGIAVHDIKGLQKTAGLAKLVRQTKLICDVETALFLGVLPKCLMKHLRWTALVLPSPMRAVLVVRPLNPMEKRLPRDVLAAAYKVAKERKSGGAFSRQDAFAMGKNSTKHGSLVLESSARMKNDLVAVRKICEENNVIVRQLMERMGTGLSSL